jgi:hypothetical protein
MGLEACVMDRLIPVLAIFALVVGWNAFIYKHSGGRMRPLWIAFSTTAIAIVLMTAGLIGYTLDRHDRFVAHTAWTGHVIWSQIGVGLLFALAAAFFWRNALPRLRS